jgi:hypothetical protein
VLVLVALLFTGGVWRGLSWFFEQREQSQEVTALLKQGQLQAGSGNYAGAWNLLEQAAVIRPASSEVIDAHERLAMDWLDNARGSQLTGNLKDIAEKVSPVLSRGAVAGKGQRSADLLAHMGWADFLRSREGVGGLDPAQNYWLYPEDQLPQDKYQLYLYMLAQFQELNGDRTDALASYQKLRSLLGGARGTLLDHSNAAIKRLLKQ